MENTLTYEAPNYTELEQEAASAVVVANSFEVNSQSTYELAADEVRTAKTQIAALNEKRLSITRKFDALKQDVMNLFSPALKHWETVKLIYEPRMLAFVKEQDEIRRKEQARLEEMARAERARLAEEARVAEESARKIEEEAAKKAAKMTDQVKAQALIAQAAERAENARQDAEAAKLTASVVVAASSSVSAPVATGTSVRKTWKCRCDDKAKLILFVTTHPEYLGLLDVNESALNQIAKAQKNNMKIDGCVAYEDSSIASRK
jgi:hypothetical protein